MGILDINILGIIQGIAEFLPISSSAHLIIFRDVFGIGAGIPNDLAMTLDIALHLGTLLAIGIYFFNDFITMICKGLTKGVKDKEGKMLWYLIVATIPAAIVGVLFEEVIENALRSNYILIACALIFMGILIYIVDKKMKQKESLEGMNIKQAFSIGCAQVFALIPGFSRSGTTITAARAFQLKREDAAKFSFYLSAPVVCGAVFLKLLESSTWTLISTNLTVFLIGILVAFLSGLFCISFLLKYLKKHDFKLFMWYRIILGIVVILMTTF